MYRCKECGAKAWLDAGEVQRECDHKGTVIADMSAVAYGESRVQDNSMLLRIRTLGLKLLEAMRGGV